MILDIILKIRFWWILITNKNALPKTSTITDPEMKYEIFSGAFIWEDEGLWEAHPDLGAVFKHVIHHRTQLVIGSDKDIGALRSKKFDKQMFNMAKRYFPDWIGFDKSRCSYNPEVANRMLRIIRVADWKLDKMIKE